MSVVSPSTLSVTAQRIYSSLPPYYQGDPTLARILGAIANELDRAEAMLRSIQSGLIPTIADDTFHLLEIWEGILGLPVAPPQLTLTQRQANIGAALLKRAVMSGADWQAAMSKMIGSTNWEHHEGDPGPGQMLITAPFTPESFQGALLLSFARQITPASYQVAYQYAAGWIVGVSEVGDVI